MDCQVIHHTEGRCRIRVPRLVLDSEFANKLNWLIESLPFVTSVRLNPAANSLIVTYETGWVTDDAAIEKLVGCIQQAQTSVEQILPETKPLDRPQVFDWEFLGFPFISLGLALTAAPLELPALVVGAAIAGAAFPWFNRATQSIVVNRQPNTDLLDSLWMTFHTLNGQFIAPSLKTALVSMRRTGRGMKAEDWKQQFQSLLTGSQESIWVERDGQEQRLPLSAVVVGDRAIVYSGSAIPVDGQIVEGTALIDERKLTGDPNPVFVRAGQNVYASTLVLEGKLCILVQRIGDNTRVGLACQLLQAEPVYDTQLGTLQAEFAKSAVVPTVCLGATIFALTGAYGPAITPFQLDFGSGIQIAMPTAILAALVEAAQNGVYIRSGRVLEVLAQIDTIIFDQTGTLTQGNATVVAIQTADPAISPTEVLTFAAAAEAPLNHPVANAIIHYAQAQGIQPPECEEWNYQVGMGVTSQIAGQTILVGSDRFLQAQGVNLDSIQQQIDTGTDSPIYVARDGKALGVILYDDPMRPGCDRAIATLQAHNLDLYMVTADEQPAACAFARQLGINPSHVHARATSSHKAELVQALRHHGKTVAFVGDGINETAALAFADVSVSFASSSEVEQETADVILLDDDLESLTYAIALAKQAMEIAYQNAAIVIIPNLVVVTGGIFFGLNPVVNVITNNLTALIAEFVNSSRSLLSHRGSATKRNFNPSQAATVESPVLATASSLQPFFNGNSQGNQVESSIVNRLKQSDLAKRLGLNSQALTHYRSKPEFSSWSMERDPEGTAWTYDPESRYFYQIGY